MFVRTRRVLLAATALAPVAVAACATGRQDVQPGTASKEPATIRWSTYGNSTDPMVQAVEQGLALFKQQQPHITVEPESQGPSWQEKNVSQWLAGTGPDMSGAVNQFLPTWSRKGLLLILDSRIKRDFTPKQIQDYVEFQWKFFSTERGQHALPMFLATAGMGYNKDLFRRAGVPFPDDTWDWQKQLEAAQRLTDVPAGLFGLNAGTAIPRLNERITQNGGAIVDPNDDTKCVMDQPAAIEALQWVHDRIWKQNVSAQPSQRGNANLMRDGRAAMWEQGGWDVIRFARDIGDAFDWDVTIYPRNKQRGTVATTDGWAIWSGSKVQDACWLLLKFLQTDEWNDIMMRVTGNGPARKSLADKWIRTLKASTPKLADKNLTALVDGMAKGYARPNPVFRFDDEVRPDLTQALAKTMDRNEAPLADTVRTAVATVNAKLKQLAGK